MPCDLLETIGACPACRGALRVERSAYVCSRCSKPWSVTRGVPRFVSGEHYAGNFGFEWRRHRKLQVDSDRHRESEQTFREKTGLEPEDVRGKLVLDVGVGTGRFSDVVARWGGTPVGVDLSLAVESAHRNLSKYPGSLVVQGDIFELPFKPESFDIVFSIGVLHHTRSTREALRSIAPLVKPGGRLAVGIYESSPTWDYSDRYRRWTTRMSYSLLHLLSHVSIPYFHVLELARSLPHGEFLAGNLFRALPTRIHPDAHWRILDTFDWFSPHYQWKHDEAEVKRWFTELGFQAVSRLPERTMVSVRGTRPSEGPLLVPSPSEERRTSALAPLPSWIPDRQPLRDLVLFGLLSLDVMNGYTEVAADMAGEARRKLLGGDRVLAG
ncbi:MAG TPA: class I SAM-dependent methyltransferase [Planctomycetota bacterium]|nr:class I SAM-dependent methyltransferase [Planctomycetota bacterium]